MYLPFVVVGSVLRRRPWLFGPFGFELIGQIAEVGRDVLKRSRCVHDLHPFVPARPAGLVGMKRTTGTRQPQGPRVATEGATGSLLVYTFFGFSSVIGSHPCPRIGPASPARLASPRMCQIRVSLTLSRWAMILDGTGFPCSYSERRSSRAFSRVLWPNTSTRAK